MLYILCTTYYFWVVDFIFTMHYAVFSGGGCDLYYALRSFSGSRCYIYYALRSNFGGRMLFILCTTQYSRLVVTIYTMHYVVFLGGGFYIYYALRSIYGGRMRFILCTTQFFREQMLYILRTPQ